MVGNQSHQSILMATTTITATPKTNHVNTVLLYGVPIVSLYIDGMERLCLAQISNTLLKQYSYNEIHNRRVALGITCVQCTPVQLELLRRAGAMPVSSRRCGMITRREAERLCRSFLGDNSPPRLPDDFSFTVQHKCAWGCRGAFLPSRYNSSRAKCIKCCYCGLFYSPNKFIFHSHRLSVSAKYTQPDAANFNSWRRHMFLCGDPPEDIMHAWEDVKAMFNGGTRKRCITSPRVPASDCCKKIRTNSETEIITTLTSTTTTTTATTTIATTSNSTHNTQFMLDYFWQQQQHQQQHSTQSISAPTTPTATTTHFPWLKLKSEFSTHFRLPTTTPSILPTTHTNSSSIIPITSTTTTTTSTNLCSLVALSATTSSAFKPVNNRKQQKPPKMEYAEDIDDYDDVENDLKGKENIVVSEGEEEEIAADETEDEEIVVDIETMEEDEEQPVYNNKLMRKQIVNNNNNNNNSNNNNKNIEIEINVDVNVVDDDDDEDNVEVGFKMNVDETNDTKRKQIKSNKSNTNTIIKTTTTAESMLLLSATGATTTTHRQQLPHYNDNNNISMFAANCFLKKQFDKQHKIYTANDDLQQLQQQQQFLANSTSLKSEQFMMSNLMDATKLRLRLNLTKDNYNFYQQQQQQQQPHINNENDDQRPPPQHSHLFATICNSNNSNNNNNNIVAVDLLNYQNPHLNPLNNNFS